MAPTRKRGTIARIIADKAYGFIHCPTDLRDYFFHKAHVEERTPFAALQPGDAVEFDIAEGIKGLEAQAVTLLYHHAVEGHDLPPEANRR